MPTDVTFEIAIDPADWPEIWGVVSEHCLDKLFSMGYTEWDDLTIDTTNIRVEVKASQAQ